MRLGHSESHHSIQPQALAMLQGLFFLFFSFILSFWSELISKSSSFFLYVISCGRSHLQDHHDVWGEPCELEVVPCCVLQAQALLHPLSMNPVSLSVCLILGIEKIFHDFSDIFYFFFFQFVDAVLETNDWMCFIVSVR